MLSPLWIFEGRRAVRLEDDWSVWPECMFWNVSTFCNSYFEYSLWDCMELAESIYRSCTCIYSCWPCVCAIDMFIEFNIGDLWCLHIVAGQIIGMIAILPSIPPIIRCCSMLQSVITALLPEQNNSIPCSCSAFFCPVVNINFIEISHMSAN